jgi:phage repressor protein C with HTH and peptisase S24 domain
VQLGIALGRTPRYLQTGKGPKGPTLPDAGESPMRKVDTVTIHELDVHAAAGLGTDMDGDIMAGEEAGAVIGSFTFPSSGFREAYGAQPDGVKMIAVRGDSMIPTLWPGQRCMVDTNDRIPSPPGVFVVWDGMGLVLKRLELIPGSGDPMRVRIMSDNPKYTAYERTLDEAHINGRVVGVWARM